jgi:hypothetical protein
VLKALRTAGTRVATIVGRNVLLKVTAILALAALAAYILTRAASGRGLVWGDIPTWVAGAGTVGALFVAFYQIGQERKRRIAQEAEDRQERRLAQARLIAAWPGIQLVNGSAEPVYSLFACLVFIQGAAPHTIEDWLGHGQSGEAHAPLAVLRCCRLAGSLCL